MPSIPRPKLNKIPGDYMPIAEQERHSKDLTTLTYLELRDLKARQEKLLDNKKQLQKLPDKGKRIQEFHGEILREVERRTNVEEAAKLFSTLNIAANGQKGLNNLEWNGKLSANDDLNDPTLDVLDSDDEIEMDPLRVIAQKQMHERRVKVIQSEPSLVTEDDLIEIQSFKTDSSNSDITTTHNCPAIDAEIVNIDVKPKLKKIKKTLSSHNKSKGNGKHGTECLVIEPHVNYLIEKTELHKSPAKREKFKPFYTTISNVHDPMKEKMRKTLQNWENTAATPPHIQHNAAQMLSLMESVEIQEQYLNKLKELQEKQAAERLLAREQRMERLKIHMPNDKLLKKLPSFTIYRSSDTTQSTTVSESHLQSQSQPDIEGNQSVAEGVEFFDVLDEEASNGVNYMIYK